MSGTYTIGRIGLVICGAYSAATTYAALDVVEYNGSSYVCKADTTGNAPTDTQYWMLLGQGDVTGTHGHTFDEVTRTLADNSTQTLDDFADTLAFTSTDTPAVTPTLASCTCFELNKFGRFVNFQIRYSSTIASGVYADGAVIPEAYRPYSENLMPLAVYASPTSAVVKAYVAHDGTVHVRTSESLTAVVLAGSWTTA